MARRARFHVRDFRKLLWAAILALCAAQAAGELHLHDIGAPDELCTPCSLAPADLTGSRAAPSVSTPGWVCAKPAETSGARILSHPFDAPRSRAPPPQA